MRIDPISTRIISTEQKEAVKAEAPQEKEKAGKKTVQLSHNPLVQKAKDGITAYESQMSEKVSALKEQIDNGTYKVDEDRLAQILEKLI